MEVKFEVRINGDAWVRFLGGALMATLAATVALAFWTIAPLVAGIQLIRARDL